MGDGALSQDEINALLQGADDVISSPEPMGGMGMPASGGVSSLSPTAQSNLSNLMNSAASLVCSSLSGYLGGKNIVLANAVIESNQQDVIRRSFSGNFVQVSMDYSGSLNGKNLVVFHYNDAGSISSVMMGDDSGAIPADITDAHQMTIQEFSNQFVSSMATQFGNKVGGVVNSTPLEVSVANNPNDLHIPYGEVVKITYDIIIDGVLNSKFYYIIDSSISDTLISATGTPSKQVNEQNQSFKPQAQINSVRFPQMGAGAEGQDYGDINLLLDVEMTMTVELGRTTKLVKDILGLGEGSIIELDKLAGEPVDLLVNGKLIARGEVVVIDENFGVRVTDIVSQDERFKS